MAALVADAQLRMAFTPPNFDASARMQRARRDLRPLQLALGAWLISAYAGSTCAAQINAEALVASVQQSGVGAIFQPSVSLRRGNVDYLSATADLALRFATQHPDAGPNERYYSFRDRLLVFATIDFKSVAHERLVSAGYLHVRFTRMQWLRYGAEVYAQAQTDTSRLLLLRVITGAGLRIVLFNHDHFASWFGTGYAYEHEERNIAAEDRPPLGPDAPADDGHRWSNYLSCVVDVWPERLTLINVVYVQPRFDDLADVHVLEEFSVAIKLPNHFSFYTNFLARYDSRPPRSVEKLDIDLLQGLAFWF